MPGTGRSELGEFLQVQRRQHAAPPRAQADPRRRATGLRREEVAAAAFITPEYYRRIEQGRFVASDEVLGLVAEALHLDADQRRYLHDLAAIARGASVPGSTSRLDAGLLRFIGSLSEPAFIIGPLTRFEAWNDAATAFFLDFAAVAEARRSCIELVFTDEEFAQRFVDVAAMRCISVGILRAAIAAHPVAASDLAVIDGLRTRSPEFDRLWRSTRVQQPHDSLPMGVRRRDGVQFEAELVVMQTVQNPALRVLVFHGVA